MSCSDEMKRLADILHSERCSLVIGKDGSTTIYRQRGVADLLQLLKESPSKLSGAIAADKVVGKGAAALMAAGGISAVYADVMSRPALKLLRRHGIAADCGRCVDNIINRTGTGLCPVETLCLSCDTADECLPLIEQFVNNQSN